MHKLNFPFVKDSKRIPARTLRQGEDDDDDDEEEGLELETLAFESLYCGKINITI